VNSEKNMKIKSFKDIRVWKNAHQITLEIYKITEKYPKEERFGLTSQLRKASSSICANIVEGYYRNTTKELINFLYIARGSTGECMYFLLLAHRLKYLNKKQFDKLESSYKIIIKQINAWIKSLKERKK